MKPEYDVKFCVTKQNTLHSATHDSETKGICMLSLVRRPVIAIDSVEGLCESEKQQHDSGDEGEDGPGIAEVVVRFKLARQAFHLWS